jgi:UTP--glucose-1-phosphate uridylyltransferase
VTKKSILDHFTRNVTLEQELISKGKGAQAEMIKKLSEKVKISYVIQDKALGLGHAVLQAKELIGDDEAFALLLGDDVIYNDGQPALGQMMDKYHEYNGASILGVQEVSRDLISNYGIIEPGQVLDNRTDVVLGLVEKPPIEKAPSNLSIMGRYILSSKIFDFLEENNVDDATNEIQITDSILRLTASQIVLSYKFKGRRYDLGSKLGFIQANLEYSLRDPGMHDKVMDMMKNEYD